MIRLILLLIFVPFIAVAQTVTIRSGEHDTFSRLVLSIGIGTQWELDQVNDTILLKLAGATAGFDVTEVFERIPRDRVSEAIQVAPDTLRLTLVCSCDYEAFLWRPGQLVLDIFDEDAPRVVNPMSRPREVSTPERQTALVPDITPRSGPSVLPSILILETPAPYVAPTPPMMSLQPAPENDLSATETALAEGIARAASQGFLDPSIKPLDLDDAQEDPPIEIIVDPQGIPNRPGVGISTAQDRDLARLGAIVERSVDQHCLPEDLFQIDDWANNDTLHAQVANLAEALAGEFGEEPIEAEESLARLYVHYGFGAEARLVLSASTATSRSRLVLHELAGVVDGDEEDYPLISSQADCTTSASLWAFLVSPSPQDEQFRNQVMQHFFALPNPLRSQISPRLARQFIEIGESDAAERLLYSAELTDAGATHYVASTRALVAERAGDPASAMEVLSREANDNARTTPQSLIRLIELQLEQGLTPAEADLLLVASLRTEYEGTPINQQLIDVEAKGRIANQQYQLALDLVVKRTDDIAVLIQNAAYMAITNEADAGEFLEFAYGDVLGTLEPDTENAMAARLIELGFSDRASSFLTGPASREAAATRRYLRAEAALDSGDFLRVIDSLLGMDDDRARALRARAYEGLGEYREALASLNPDQPASSPNLQFRANAWERLTVEDDDVLSSFAQVVLESADNDVPNTLADRRAILAQSQESRRAVEDLLLRFDGTTPQQ